MMLVANFGRTPRFGLGLRPPSEPTPAAAATPFESSSSSLCTDDGEPETATSVFPEFTVSNKRMLIIKADVLSLDFNGHKYCICFCSYQVVGIVYFKLYSWCDKKITVSVENGMDTESTIY